MGILYVKKVREQFLLIWSYCLMLLIHGTSIGLLSHSNCVYCSACYCDFYYYTVLHCVVSYIGSISGCTGIQLGLL